MSTDTTSGRPKHPRPRTVSLPCLFVGVTAFLTLTELIAVLTDWGTVGMQEALQPLRKALQATGTDVTTTELLRFLRWGALALIPLTVSAAVFAVYAMRGDRTGRVMTSALGVVGGLLSMTVGVALLGSAALIQSAMLLLAAAALWSPQASRWYRGLPALAASSAFAAETSERPVEQASAHPQPAPVLASVRPTSVLTAGVVTILGSIAAGGFASIYLLVYTFARAAYIQAVQTGPFGDMISAKDIDLMMRFTLWVSVVIVPLAVAGLLGATLLLARNPLGRITTLVWAWGTAVVGVLMLPIGLLAMVGAGAVIFLLARDDARQWTSGTAPQRRTLS